MYEVYINKLAKANIILYYYPNPLRSGRQTDWQDQQMIVRSEINEWSYHRNGAKRNVYGSGTKFILVLQTNVSSDDVEWRGVTWRDVAKWLGPRLDQDRVA